MEKNNYGGILQKSINSGFNGLSTTKDVSRNIDLTGKIAIVTGGYAGIGLETTKTLSLLGAKVIVPARDIQKAKKNLKGIENVEIYEMNLMNPSSIDSFSEKFLSSGRPLHLLINNAGIMWVPLRRDSRGYESQLSTNHLGHFHLTSRLWSALKKANGARVVNVSSFGHQMAPFNFEDPNFENREYQTLQGYGQSKTANILFSLELDNRGKKFNVRSYSLHPGSINDTDLGREADIELFKQMGTHDENGNIFADVSKKLKTIPQGASTTVWCATSPMLNNIGGVYCNNADIDDLDTGNIDHIMSEPLTLRGVKPYALDESNAKKLWELSEKMIGIRFNID
jgi:NAD(P)-dependent dehydrogenase (short-subunit alcohol dehydrogenase family)